MPSEISFVIFLQFIGSTDFKIQEEINLMKNSLQKSFELRTKNAYNNKTFAINEDPDFSSLYGFKGDSF